MEIILTEEDIKMLQIKKFYEKAIKNNYQTDELGNLAAHVCYNNIEFSLKIAKKLVFLSNKSSGDDIIPTLKTIGPFLMIKDDIR